MKRSYLLRAFGRLSVATAFMLLLANYSVAQSAPFETIGVPVMKAGLMGTLVGPGPTEDSERIYVNFRQDGGKLFLVAIDPETGDTEQFASPVGTGAWGFIVGPDNKIYLGTHEGPAPGDSGQVLVFDPTHPEKAIEIVGRPAASESYLWMYTIGVDKKLYACTFPGAKIVSYDPATGEMADHGAMDPTQKYTRNIVTGPDGMIYVGVGYGRANVVRFNPETGEHLAILPEQYRNHEKQTFASVQLGVDGQVYISSSTMVPDESGNLVPKAAILVPEGDGVREVTERPEIVAYTTLKDGRRVSDVGIDGTYTLVSPDGTSKTYQFTYEGAGSGIFMVDNGPLGRIYGGTAMPNELFYHDPASGALENPGNATETGGEIYSMLDHHGTLYLCAYPGSFLSKWDPTQAWDYGRKATNNPRGFGPLGPGHLRPRAMIHGPDEKIYIGSYPEYGRLGGSLGVWDPAEDKLLENHPQLIENQSIVALVYDPTSGLVFGGSSIAGGGGSTPTETEAKFFAFDPTTKSLKFARTVVAGDRAIRSLCRVENTIYGVSGEDMLFVYDIKSDTVIHTGDLDVGNVLDVSLRPWKDGNLYGLSSSKVFRLDPKTYAAEVLAEYPGRIYCGFAIDDKGIYFGEAAELKRYNWPKN